MPESASTLHVIGGLYGNEAALDAVDALAAAEPGPVTQCFNGDFNWFNREPESFARVNRRVLQADALRGNVETEIAAAEDHADCGCAYPEWVDQGVVDRSNHIIRVLRESAKTQTVMTRQLHDLPMYRCYRVAGKRVLALHGDPESLAGWGLCQEYIDSSEQQQVVAHWHRQSRADVFACTHTCLPFLYRRAGAVVINNGAAGMPNFSGSTFGILTRIADSPCAVPSLYGLEQDGLYIDALAIRYDQHRWLKAFVSQWPETSPAHTSYFARMLGQVDYTEGQALRDFS